MENVSYKFVNSSDLMSFDSTRKQLIKDRNISQNGIEMAIASNLDSGIRQFTLQDNNYDQINNDSKNIFDKLKDYDIEQSSLTNRNCNFKADSNRDLNSLKRPKSFKSIGRSLNKISDDLLNFFYEYNDSKHKINFFELETHLLEEWPYYKKIYLESKNENSSMKKEHTKEDVIIKMKIQDDFLESSVINSESVDKLENQSISNNIGIYAHKLEINNDKNLKLDYINSRISYFEKTIAVVLHKYKPLVIEEDGEILQKGSNLQSDPNLNKKSLGENYKKFSHEMKELDKKITDKLAQIKFGVDNINEKSIVDNTQEELNEDSSFLNLKELKILNEDNIIFKKVIFILYKYPTENNFLNWKTQLLILFSKWKNQEDNVALAKFKKIKIKYLKTRLIIEKIINHKQSHSIDKYLMIENYKPTHLNNYRKKNQIINLFFIPKNEKLPYLTFLSDSTVMITYDFFVDLQTFFFLLMCPVWLVISMENQNLIILANLFNAMYFYNMLREFRRLPYNETNNVMVKMNQHFKNVILRTTMIFDIISLIPYVCFSSKETLLDDFLYKLTYLAPLVRLFNFGRSLEFLEKTKYAIIFRLIILILKFFIFAHMIGLVFVKYYNFDFFADEYYLEDKCKVIADGRVELDSSCKYVIALMDGTYLIPGGVFNLLAPKALSDILWLFCTLFVGQIIVAYVFGNVTQLIKNLNQAAYIYREKIDAIKSFNSSYGFDKNITNEITTYYEYIWLKKRNFIYEKDLLGNLSETLLVKISDGVYPNYKYFLKDFYGISKKKEKKLISTLIFNMKEYIAFPYERIYTQGQIINGLFILTDGTAIFTDGIRHDDELDEDGLNNIDTVRFDFNHKVSVNRKEYLNELKLNKKYGIEEKDIDKNSKDPNLTCFPLDSIFLKTGRAIESCYVDDFCDFLIIDLKFFDSKLLINFPEEMQVLKNRAMIQGLTKIGKNGRIQKLVFKHSARSIGAYFEEKYTLENIWIDLKNKISTLIDESQINFSENNPYYHHAKGLFEFNFKYKFNI